MIDGTQLTLRYYADAVRRRWWLVALVPFVAFVAAVVPALGENDQFRSSVTVRIHSGDPSPPVASEDGTPPPTVGSADLQVLEVQTELSVLRSSGLRSDVVDELRAGASGFGAVTAASDGFSSAIVVSVHAASADVATEAARAYGDVYIDRRTSQVIEPLRGRATALVERSTAIAEELAAVDEQLADPTTEPFLISSLQVQRAGLEREASDLAARADVLEVEADRRSAQTMVISPATTAVALGSDPFRDGLQWLVVGLAAGLVAAILLRIFWDDRFEETPG